MAIESRTASAGAIDDDLDDELTEVIVGYLGAHYGVEPDQVTAESTLDDLGVDSLGVLGIAEIVENKYAISLDDERIAAVRTLADFGRLVAIKRAERAGAAGAESA